MVAGMSHAIEILPGFPMTFDDYSPALLLAARSPWSRSLAVDLRRASYRRYGAEPPVGAPLTLEEAADRLRRARTMRLPLLSPVAILGSRTDTHSAAQRELARRLGTTFQ